MSFCYECDWCGNRIHEADQVVTLRVEGERDDLGRRNTIDGYVAHYHGIRCWTKMHAAIRLVHELQTAIDGIPVITGQAVAARRRKHTREDG